MSKTYTVLKDDTLSGISQKFYGDKNQYPKIFNANELRSGNPDLIYPGEILIIPDIPSDKNNDLNSDLKIVSQNENDSAIIIDGERLTGFKGLTISRNMDTCADGFGISTTFQPGNENLIKAFRPFGYQSARIYLGQDLLINGSIEKCSPAFSGDSTTMNLEGRAITGILIDCSITKYPIEFKNQNLKQITDSIIEPFGLLSKFDSDPGAIFETVRAENGQTVFSFLSGLAQQRGILISSTPKGELLFWKANTTAAPVANFIQGEAPFIGGGISFDGAQRFRTYTALGQSAGQESKKGVYIDKNLNIHRPLIFMASDTDSGNIDQAAKWKGSNNLSNSISFSINVPNWRDKTGNLWKENKIVTVKAPSLFIPNESRFLIKSLSYNLSETDKTTTLNLVLPQSYDPDYTGAEPWE